MLSIASFISRDQIKNLDSTDKTIVLEELCGLIPDNSSFDKSLFLSKLIEREQDCSTGLGMGIAIPHARLPDIRENRIYVGRSREGIDFESPDGSPVHLIFMITVSTNQSQYLQIISRISWLVRNEELRSQLFRTDDIDELYRLLSEH